METYLYNQEEYNLRVENKEKETKLYLSIKNMTHFEGSKTSYVYVTKHSARKLYLTFFFFLEAELYACLSKISSKL